MPMVKMVHKSWKPEEKRQPSVVEKQMFDSLWKDKGWILAKEDGSSSSPSSSSSSSGKSSGS